MEKFTQHTGLAIPLPIKDVDTDMIIPAQYLTSISREGYGENVFRRLRDENADFPLNDPQFSSGTILIAHDNFGCGSSREHAAWALLGWGIRAIIAPSFADIFKNNSGKNGLVLIELDESIVTSLLENAAEGGYELTIDLAVQEVQLPDGTKHSFEYDSFRKECILNGYDETDYLLSHQAEIAEYKQKRDEKLYYSTLTPNN